MSSNYSVTRDQVIVTALRKLGVIEPSDNATSGTIDTNIMSNAQTNFNLMVKAWATDGFKLWTTSEITLPLVAGQTVYTIGPVGPDLTTDKPLKIIQAFLRNKSVAPTYNDIPMTVVSEQEYNMLGSKFSQGNVNTIQYKVGVSNCTVKVFLTPDTNTATNYELHLVVQRPLLDLPSGADAALTDWPNEWFNALVWGLADDLALEYPVTQDKRTEIALKAHAHREQLTGWDVEAPSTFFQIDYRAQYPGR